MCRYSRFLADEAPSLPLPDCDRRATCPCTFKHYEDRRAGPRRTDDLKRGVKSDAPALNRRAARGRRPRDQA
jgi:hypothetical protein